MTAGALEQYKYTGCSCLRHRPRAPPLGRPLEVVAETGRPPACSGTQETSLHTFQVPEDPTGQSLTVRLLIPSENTPICLTVPSESSICQRDRQTGLKRAIKSKDPRSLSTPGPDPPRKREPAPSGSCCSWACPHSWGRRSPRRRRGASVSNCQSRRTTDASAVKDANNQTFGCEETPVASSTLALAVAVRTL